MLRPFVPGSDLLFDGSERLGAVLDRLNALSDVEVDEQLEQVAALFGNRHRPGDLDAALTAHFGHVQHRYDNTLTSNRQRLISLHLTNEYAIEAAALGNPSIVAAPDQSGLGDGALRVVISLRSVGEGHRSSISFRTAVIGPDLDVTVDEPSQFAGSGRCHTARYDRSHFERQITEHGGIDANALHLVANLNEHFERRDLDAVIRTLDPDERSSPGVRYVVWLADSNYEVDYDARIDLTERVLFPNGPAETEGMEDARFVHFTHDDGSTTYYGTYTAFDGSNILPQLIETSDFRRFRISTLQGTTAQNKGIALFPRKIDGSYMALGRHDNVNNFVMRSDTLREWNRSQVIQEPTLPWEVMQLGNCGSPIETEHGWLVITHGVGAMRRYTIGALLLDLNDPTVVVGHLRQPLLEPDETERNGYVPNVVYSCGATVHNGHLVLPYGYSDFGASIATVPLDDLLAELR